MGFCSKWIEALFGPKTNVTPPPIAEAPVVESFCRSNRYTEWLDGMLRDMRAIKADRVTIRCYGDDVKYRASLGNGFHEDRPDHSVFYNSETLETISVAELFRKGVESGLYSTEGVVTVDSRERYERQRDPEKDPRTHRCIDRFVNKVEYKEHDRYHHDYMHRLHRDYARQNGSEWNRLGKEWAPRYKLAEPWNKGRMVVVRDTEHSFICVDQKEISSLFNHDTAGKITLHSYLKACIADVSIRTIPLWIARDWLDVNKVLKFLDPLTGEKHDLFDPIRVRKLEPDEEYGTEAYVALVLAKNADTYTRTRYRVEVDSELLMGGTICNMVTLYKGVSKRLVLGGADPNGKLYVDNFHYIRNDGTEHTPDPAGFSTIGAEPFYDRRVRVYREKNDGMSHTPMHGPFLVTNQDFPEAPIY